MLCSKFRGVLLLVSRDKGKLPPSLRRCRPRQLVDLRTSVVLPPVSGDMWLPISSTSQVVVTGVTLHDHLWRRVLPLL